MKIPNKKNTAIRRGFILENLIFVVVIFVIMVYKLWYEANNNI